MRKRKLIKIKKEDAIKLNKEYGVCYGENGISKTHSHHPHYYLCCSEYNLQSLLKISMNDEAQDLLDRFNTKKRRYNKKKY